MFDITYALYDELYLMLSWFIDHSLNPQYRETVKSLQRKSLLGG